MAGRYDIDCEKGATFRRVITWGDENESPINLTGFSARMQVREAFTSSTTVASLTNANGKITLGGATGQVTIQLTASDTAALPVSTTFGDAWVGVYDLELVAPSGDVTRLLEGQFVVTPEVTR